MHLATAPTAAPTPVAFRHQGEVIAEIRPEASQQEWPRGWKVEPFRWHDRSMTIGHHPRFQIARLEACSTRRPVGEVLADAFGGDLVAAGWRCAATDSTGCEVWFVDRAAIAIAQLGAVRGAEPPATEVWFA